MKKILNVLFVLILSLVAVSCGMGDFNWSGDMNVDASGNGSGSGSTGDTSETDNGNTQEPENGDNGGKGMTGGLQEEPTDCFSLKAYSAVADLPKEYSFKHAKLAVIEEGVLTYYEFDISGRNFTEDEDKVLQGLINAAEEIYKK